MNSLATWHPVVPAHELRTEENIVGALVHGQELALWRSAQGVAQAWENRCPHRGVRLTLGRLVDGRLACGYHGWEYAAGSGRCEAIPALPDVAVPGKVCVKTYPVRETHGMVWASLDAVAAHDPASRHQAPSPDKPALAAGSGPPETAVFFRTLAVRCGLGRVHAAMAQRGYAAQGPNTWRGSMAGQPMLAFTLSAEPALSCIHWWCMGQPGSVSLPAVFAAARRLRSELESGAL